MALKSNTREQLAKRLAEDLRQISPELAQVRSVDSAGNPVVQLAGKFWLVVRQRSFNGFQVVAELSSSAAEGLPEHELWLVANSTTADIIEMAKVMKAAAQLGCSSIKVVSKAGATLADAIEAEVDAELPNTRIGASGQ